MSSSFSIHGGKVTDTDCGVPDHSENDHRMFECKDCGIICTLPKDSGHCIYDPGDGSPVVHNACVMCNKEMRKKEEEG